MFAKTIRTCVLLMYNTEKYAFMIEKNLKLQNLKMPVVREYVHT